MQTPLEIAFRHIEPTDEIKSLIEEKAADLERLYDGITSCHVYVRAPHQSPSGASSYELTIEVRVPGNELVIRHNKNEDVQHLHVAVRDAFARMESELKRWKERMQGEVKTHTGMLQGRISEIHHDEGYGQIIATDHRLIYFHRNSVVDGSFDELEQNDPVELVVQTGESEIGPQASTVRRIGALAYDPTPKPGRQ